LPGNFCIAQAKSGRKHARFFPALVLYLENRKLIRNGPFDSMVNPEAGLEDLSSEKIRRFVGIARRARGFPLTEDTEPRLVLEHLHLLKEGRPTHAALLLFGIEPQRFVISSEITCAHFHGTQVAKPIPFYRIYKGTVFDLVDQAVDFVLSKINLAVGTRAQSTQAPVAYEMPPDVVREAIVNAVAHRDYTSHGSVQVMLFADRLEVWNPGTLPPTLTLEQLRRPHGSVPANPLLAEPLYLTKYIERMGTGTGDMIARCRKAGLPDERLDFGLVRGDAARENLGGSEVGRINYVIVVPERLRPRRLSLKVAQTELPHAALGADGQFTERVKQVAARLGVAFQPRVTCDSLVLCLAAVKTGRYAAVVPRHAVRDLVSIDVIESAELDELSRPMMLIWNPRSLETLGENAGIVRNALRASLIDASKQWHTGEEEAMA
jgi:hypothetical protein